MLTIKLPQIFRVHQVPRIFWEEGIMSGYRHPKSSALDCVLSSFQLNNETVNIWTHFLPTWYFLWRLVMLSYCLDFWSDAYSWPFLAYMTLVCLYPFTSSCAHTFSTMSTHARHICYFLDYNALSLYSLGSWSWSGPAGARPSEQPPSSTRSSSTTSRCSSGFCSVLATIAHGMTLWPVTSTTSPLPCSPASSLRRTCQNGWLPVALISSVIATSCFTSAPWLALISSWKQFWGTCTLAGPGSASTPHRPCSPAPLPFWVPPCWGTSSSLRRSPRPSSACRPPSGSSRATSQSGRDTRTSRLPGDTAVALLNLRGQPAHRRHLRTSRFCVRGGKTHPGQAGSPPCHRSPRT
ncbi:membrane progestin receptor delta isoform 1-T1 [Liasis olivaceus]